STSSVELSAWVLGNGCSVKKKPAAPKTKNIVLAILIDVSLRKTMQCTNTFFISLIFRGPRSLFLPLFDCELDLRLIRSMCNGPMQTCRECVRFPHLSYQTPTT